MFSSGHNIIFCLNRRGSQWQGKREYSCKVCTVSGESRETKGTCEQQRQ